MNRDEITALLSDQVKALRAEYNLSQETFSGILGLSKKTLIQVEKGRSQLNWSTVIALCALFNESEALRAALGDDPIHIVRAATYNSLALPKKTMGGKIWWRELRQSSGFRLQQNLVSGHYRILDARDRRWFSSFDYGEVVEEFHGLAEVQGGEPLC